MFQWAMASGESLAAARTVAVDVFVVVEVAYLVNCRSLDRSIRQVGLRGNPWVPVGMAVMLALQLLFTYAPWMNTLFDSAPIDLVWWLRVTAVGLAVLAIVESEKWLRRRSGIRRGNSAAAPSP